MNIPPFSFRLQQREIVRLILSVGLVACALSAGNTALAQEAAAVLPSAYGVRWARDPQPELVDFSLWAQGIVKAQKAGATAAPDAAAAAMGVRLADRRHSIVAALAQTDPARALSVAVPPDVRAKLPAEVVSRLETPFSATGDYSVDRAAGRRQIAIAAGNFSAHVYGRRTELGSLHNVFLHGFLIDDQAVLDPDVLHVLPASTAETRYVVDGGGLMYRFGSFAEIQQAETHLRTLEARPASGTVDVAEKAALASSPGAVAMSTVGGRATRRAPRPQALYGNDFFANAYRLPGSSGSVYDNNIGATSEPGEPRHAGVGGGASVWYVWTPTQTGNATFSTDDGAGHFAVDTVLAAYTGTNVADLFSIASNDDYTGYNSQISFEATAGVTYHIAVDGYEYSNGPSEGNYTLSYFQQGDPNTPQISSETTVVAHVDSAFSYAIVASNSPTSFAATGLPVGLTIDTTTGVISGTPTMVGASRVIVTATNSFGTGAADLEFTVTDQPVHFSFFTSEVSLPESPGVYYLHLVGGNIFGYYAYLTNQNFIYHLDLGYEYTFDAGDGRNGIYLYDFASDTFFYTSPTFPFPYMYDFSLNTVLYYYHSPTDDARFNTNGVRYFYDFATQRIISK